MTYRYAFLLFILETHSVIIRLRRSLYRCFFSEGARWRVGMLYWQLTCCSWFSPDPEDSGGITHEKLIHMDGLFLFVVAIILYTHILLTQKFNPYFFSPPLLGRFYIGTKVDIDFISPFEMHLVVHHINTLKPFDLYFGVMGKSFFY